MADPKLMEIIAHNSWQEVAIVSYLRQWECKPNGSKRELWIGYRRNSQICTYKKVWKR